MDKRIEMDGKTVPTPNVSVIVPVYGVEHYIERCARSLFSQTFRSVEFIFVNDCTKDGSMNVLSEVMKEYPEVDVKVIDLERNMGLPQARRAGVGQATGDYILHVDSDDWIEPNMVERLYERAEETGADMVCCDWSEEHEDHDEVFSHYEASRDIYYETNDYSLTAESKMLLALFVEFLKENPTVKVEIQGHTDNIGRDDDNLLLSENRARSVYEYVVSQGIPANRLRYKGYGESNPIADNNTAAGRAKNRRTVFLIYEK